MSEYKLALAMIVKHDELELLRTCLDSVIDHVDRAFISVNYPPSVDGVKFEDEVTEFSKSYKKADFFVDEWTNFGDARNKSFKRVSDGYEFITWCDTDDIWHNAEKLKQVALATPKHIDGIYMAYDYQHDQFGNVTVQHYVARMVRNNGSFKWSDKILHESLEPTRHCGKAINEEVKVIHHADHERRDRSLQRNIEMLEKELRGEGSKPDPRTLYYLGTAYIDIGRFEEARELLQMYIRLSGWAEERSQAWVHLGNIYEYENNDAEMRKCYLHALNENPKDPMPYVELAKVEMRNELYSKAVEWLKMALSKKRDPMTTVHFSTEITYRTYMYLSECFIQMGGKNLDDAYKYAKKALEMRPDELTREHFESIERLINHRTMAEGAIMMLKDMEESEQKANIPDFIFSLPESLRDNPAILRYKKRHTPPKVWPKKSIVIFTGNSILGEWGPWSLEEGIGGSEEAVIRLGKQLKNQGWDVWVYSTPGARVGEYDGVHYRNYWELNLADKFDVFVAWRSPWFFDIDMTARRKYLWLHDVMNENEFTPERIEKVDKVILLSKYHRSLYPMIPDDKVFLSANGIDPVDFEEYDGKVERDPHRIIYMSSHVRGLQLIYEVWPEVKAEVPDAKLDIYYGWGSFDAVNRNNPERMEWKDKMIAWAESLEDVTDHGKVGQQTIVEETMKSGVWAYPCPFPEIFCITALKAQAGGAIPVSSSFAALEETVNFGIKIPMKQQDEKTPVGKWNKRELEQFKKALIKVLKDTKSQEVLRPEMMEETRRHWSWKKVAEDWTKEMK